MKVAVIADIHLGGRESSLDFDDYFSSFFRNVFFPIIKERNIKKVVIAGDLFDRRKYVNYLILSRSIDYFFNPLRNNYVDVDVILGNHDVFYRESNSINSSDLLLQSYKNIHVFKDAKDVIIDGKSFFYFPWVNKENKEETIKAIQESKAEYAFGHVGFTGFYRDKHTVDDNGSKENLVDASDFKKFKYVWTGHYHHKSTKDNITYLGSPYEFTWVDYNDPKGFHIFDTDTKEMEWVRNYSSMHQTIEYDEDSIKELMEDLPDDWSAPYKKKMVKVKVVNRKNYTLFDDFIDKLSTEATPLKLDIIDEEVFSLNENSTSILEQHQIIETDTLRTSLNYVDSIKEIPDQIDRDILKTELDTLYKKSTKTSEE